MKGSGVEKKRNDATQVTKENAKPEQRKQGNKEIQRKNPIPNQRNTKEITKESSNE